MRRPATDSNRPRASGPATGLGAAATIVVLALTMGACTKEAPLPTTRVDSGFVMGRDSFSFPNFGGRSIDARLVPEHLVRMFGASEACLEVREDGTCRPTRIAKAWSDSINETMTNGRCEGFAVLADLMSLALVEPKGFEAATAKDIGFGKPIKREIAYWYASQYTAATTTNTKALGATAAVEFLASEYAKPASERELWRVGILRLDQNGRPVAGHALTAFAVEPDSAAPGRYRILVYDNNHPADTERQIEVDAGADAWSYRAASNPDMPEALFFGNNENMNRMFLAPIRKRVPEQDFCAADGLPLSQAFGSASTEISVTDESGHRAGAFAGRIEQEIPGALLIPAFSEDDLWNDPAPQQITMPAGQAITVSISDRSAVSGDAPASLAVFETSHAFTVDGLTLNGQEDQVALTPGLYDVAYDSRSLSAMTLRIIQKLPSGVEVEAVITIPAGTSQVTLKMDPTTGNVVVGLTSANGDAVPTNIVVTKADAVGEQTFNLDVPVESGGAATLDVENAQDDATPIKVTMDDDGDGLPDRTLEIEDTTKLTAPDAPTGLTALTNAAGTAVTLDWLDASTNEERFQIERSDDAGPFALLATRAPDTISYRDSAVTREHDYAYRVRATNTAGASAWVESTASIPPRAPTSLVATAPTTTLVELTWVDNAQRETAYVVERAIDDGTSPFAVVARLAPDTARYDDTVAADTAYAYRISTEGPGGKASATVRVRTPQRPDAPTSLAATAPSGTRVELTWTEPAGAILVYEIERATESGLFAPLATQVAPATAYADTTAQPETGYRYRMRAASTADISDWSLEATVTTPPLPASNLATTAVTNGEVALAWTDNARSETGWRVARSTDGGVTFLPLASLPTDAAQYTDTTVVPDTAYVYRVVVIGAGGEASSELSVVTPPVPTAPTNLRATAVNTTRISIEWDNTQAGVLRTEIERAQGSGPFQHLADISGNGTTYSDDGVSAETSYRYRARVVTAVGISPWSQEASITTPPPAPQGLSATSITNVGVTLSWTDASTTETGYRVERATGSGGAFAVIATLPAGAATYVDAFVAEGAAYEYRVTTVAPSGSSADSLMVQIPTCAAISNCAAGSLRCTPTAGSQTCLACQGGYDLAPDGKGCTSPLTCIAGEGYTAGTPTSAPRCAACTGSTYSTGGTMACAPWRTCAAGEGFAAGTASSDATCTPCTGTTHSSGGTMACTPWRTCAAGEGYAAGTVSTDATCTPCTGSTYSTGGTMACTAWTTCGPGTAATGGSNTSNVTCSPCITFPGSTTCTPLPLTFVNRAVHPTPTNGVNAVFVDGGTVYAGTRGLGISTDGGATFAIRDETNAGFVNPTVNTVWASGSAVYAGTPFGLGVSTNGGTSFTLRLTSAGVNGVFGSGSTLYAATSSGLSKSTIGGTAFTTSTTADGLGSNSVFGVYADGSTVYAATTGGLSISTDDGATFVNRTTAQGLGSSTVYSVFASGSTVYAGTTSGLSISTDGGATFVNRTTGSGLGSSFVRKVFVVGSTVYAATLNGLSISTNGGTSFTNHTVTNGLGSATVNGVFVIGSTVYVATNGGLSISANP